MKNPVANLHTGIGENGQRNKLDALKQLNNLHKQVRPTDSQLEARIASFELAFRMQRKPRKLLTFPKKQTKYKQCMGLALPPQTFSGGSA